MLIPQRKYTVVEAGSYHGIQTLDSLHTNGDLDPERPKLHNSLFFFFLHLSLIIYLSFFLVYKLIYILLLKFSKLRF